MVENAHRCFPRKVQSARRAREWVKLTCLGWREDPGKCDALVLVTSELVSNALLHGDGPIDVDLTHSTKSIHVEVSDAGHGPINMGEPATDATHGRGLPI